MDENTKSSQSPSELYILKKENSDLKQQIEDLKKEPKFPEGKKLYSTRYVRDLAAENKKLKAEVSDLREGGGAGTVKSNRPFRSGPR